MLSPQNALEQPIRIVAIPKEEVAKGRRGKSATPPFQLFSFLNYRELIFWFVSPLKYSRFCP
jgi:hypothetical protein